MTMLYALEIPPFVYIQSQKLVDPVWHIRKRSKRYTHNLHEIDQKNMI